MANPSLSKNLIEIITIARSYVSTKIDLLKLSLLEKVSLAGAFFLSSIIGVLMVAFCLLFISLAFAFWYGQTTGDMAVGFLILAAFYLVVGIVIVAGRNYLILGPIIKALSAILYKDDEPDEEEEK